MCACTLLFEGTKEEVERQKNNIFKISPIYYGMVAGAQNGKNGYNLTFAIAYLRDLLTDYSMIGESLETACPWDKIHLVCEGAKNRCLEAAAKRGFDPTRIVYSFRVT